MFVTERLTIGQITFILRAAIQILAWGGAFLITYIILASSPQVASLTTHDIVNRILGKASATKRSLRWILDVLRGRNTDPAIPTRLTVAITLSVVFSIFASISDIGFLGFYACTVPGLSSQDRPWSVMNDTAARSAISQVLVNGTDPAQVATYRCDSAEPYTFNANVSMRLCKSWHNSTLNDPTIFAGINLTDTDILLPRQIRKYPYKRAQYLNLSSYFIGPSNKRIEEPKIASGIVVQPHSQGLKALVGVPQLLPLKKVQLDRAMMLEVEMGCMAVGMYHQSNLDSVGGDIDMFNANTNESDWRKYYGPEGLRAALSKTVDEYRAYYRPMFNESSIDADGIMVGVNSSSTLLSKTANIRKIPFSNVAGRLDGAQRGIEILGNCTQSLKQQYGLQNLEADANVASSMCSVLMIGGSLTSNGALYMGGSRMLCAATTQLNLVSATVEADATGKVNITSTTRLPSDLNTVLASFFDPIPQANGDTYWTSYEPYERYTLSHNPSGATEHYLNPRAVYTNIRGVGPASGGAVMSRVASAMLGNFDGFDSVDSAGLSALNDGTQQAAFNASLVTTWGGQVGASMVLASTGVNGWAALSSQPLMVESTGGTVATCYKPTYVLGFVPLILATALVILWTLFLFTSGLSVFKFSGQLENLYGGMVPFWGTICPTARSQETFLMWVNTPPSGPHLDVVRDDVLHSAGHSRTAVEFLRHGSGQGINSNGSSKESLHS